jgi:hypothetical protein
VAEALNASVTFSDPLRVCIMDSEKPLGEKPPRENIFEKESTSHA